MSYKLGDEIRFMPQCSVKQYCYGKIVIICTGKKTCNITYGVKQFITFNTPSLIYNSLGQNLLIVDQIVIDSFNNNHWNDYKYVNDIFGKTVYTWVLNSDIDHLYVPLQISVINLTPVPSRKLNGKYNSSTGKFELLDDDDEDCGGLKYL